MSSLISLNLSLFHIDLSDQLPKISEPEMNEQTVIQKLMYFVQRARSCCFVVQHNTEPLLKVHFFSGSFGVAVDERTRNNPDMRV